MEYLDIILKATYETIYMTFFSIIFSYILGLPLAILLYVSDNSSISKNRLINLLCGAIVNILRSIPFIILIVALIPLTRFLTGSAIGYTSSIVPLVIGSFPFVARLIESSFNEIDKTMVDCAKSMGASNMQIMLRFILPESMPSIVRGMGIASITVMGYTAMAGTVGAGGLGDVAIRYGYHRYQNDVMILTIIVLVLLVQIIQMVFNIISKNINKSL